MGRQPGPPAARPSPAEPARRGGRRGRPRTAPAGAAFPEALAKSLVLVHGGMAQNVGPILNMVTEKYLLRGRAEWLARQEALGIFDEIVDCVAPFGRPRTRTGHDPQLGRAAEADHPLGDQRLHRDDHPRGRGAALGDDFWGFLMLGGMAGGGMAFFVAPERHDEFQDRIAAIMRQAKAELDDALPFAMEPVVYDFRINPGGTVATLDSGSDAMMPPAYYALQVPRMIAAPAGSIPASAAGGRRPFRQPTPPIRRTSSSCSGRWSITSSP